MKRTNPEENGSSAARQSFGATTVPLFDCLTHPTLSGEWKDGRDQDCASIHRLVREMIECNVGWAFAVGMKGMGGYDEERYSQFVLSAHPKIFPVAYLDFDRVQDAASIKPLLASLKKRQYTGIKIHPRLSGIPLTHPLLPDIINTAADLGLVVMLCTYFYGSQTRPEADTLDNLAELLYKTKDSRIILLHAGCVRLLEMMEIARSHMNVLLDLSFTLCKYEGSSLDLDLSYAFRNFDRRICVGSDHPEFTLRMMRERFECLAAGLDKEKKENIAYRNLFKFTGIACDEAF